MGTHMRAHMRVLRRSTREPATYSRAALRGQVGAGLRGVLAGYYKVQPSGYWGGTMRYGCQDDRQIIIYNVYVCTCTHAKGTRRFDSGHALCTRCSADTCSDQQRRHQPAHARADGRVDFDVLIADVSWWFTPPPPPPPATASQPTERAVQLSVPRQCPYWRVLTVPRQCLYWRVLTVPRQCPYRRVPRRHRVQPCAALRALGGCSGARTRALRPLH